MTDLRERFEGFREVEAPELWDRIERMAAAQATRPARQWRPLTAAVAAAVFVLGLIGGVAWLLGGNDSPGPAVDQPPSTVAPQQPEPTAAPAPDGVPTPTDATATTEPPIPTTQPVPTSSEAPPESTTMPSAEMHPVPDVSPVVEEVGDWREAVDILAAAGFDVEVVVLFVPPEERESDGLVAYVEPAVGSLAPEGSTVVLAVYGDRNVELAATKPAGEWATFTDADGMASDCVGARIDVGPDGMVWVGCAGGLSRFDGASWTVISEDVVCDSLTAAVPGEVWILACDESSNLTVLRFNGVWTEYETIAVGAIAVGPEGSVWLADGIIRRLDGDVFSPVAMPDVSVFEATVGGDGVLWAAGPEAGLWRYDGRWAAIDGGRGAEYIAAAPDGNLWAGYDGVAFYDGQAWHDLGLSGVHALDFAFAPDGAVWVASESSGAFRFDGTGWIQYTTADGLAANSLTSIAVAPDGTVWFGTKKSGVSRFVPDN